MGRADLIIQLSAARKDGSKNKRGQSSTSPSEIKHDAITKDESKSNDEHVADILNDIDLFLLAKNGSVDDFRRVLDRISAAENASHDEILSRVSPAGNTLLHVAVKNGNQDVVIHIAAKRPDIVEAILSRIPSLIHLRDDEGNTPLHYAVLLGDVKEVRFLLDNYVPSATQRDINGFCPIHLAAIKDRVDILRLLLRHCPAPEELLDTYGRNILHVAAVTGSYNVVKYILSNPNFDELINMKAIYGSTPLHLATLDWHPKIVSTLTWDKRVDVKLLNYTGMTALDVAENNMDTNNPPFRQRLTWSALKSAGTPRSLTTQKRQGPEKSYLVDLCKDRVNTLLVVSTLVATVTFAAGFTMPGGYNSSATDLGMATLLRHRIFHLFVFCDTIAMHCSIVVVVALIFAQLGDLHLVLTALTLALPLLGVALSMMSLAFTAGISLVVGKLRWLSITVLVTGFTFLAILLLLFVPLCTYITSSNRILRYLSYYSFYFLMLATRSYD